MRRTTITALACLSAAAFPAAALADHGDGNDHGDGHNQPGQGFQDRGHNQFADIGQVTAFSGGKLTIAFTDGNTITATLDRQSQIQCEDMGDFRDHDRGRDDNRGGDNNQNCFSLLTAGTQVTQASVEETQNGAFWDEVDLDAGMHHDNHDS